MQFRRLGRSNLMVGEVGIGLRRRPGDEPAALADVFRAAIESGVNLVEVGAADTAALEAIAEVVRRERPRLVVIATGPGERTVVESALAALGLPHFDCYLADGPSADLAELQALSLGGLCRSVGLATDDPAEALRVVLEGIVDVVQAPFNVFELARPAGIDALLNAAQAADVGVLGCSPLAGGGAGAKRIATMEFLAEGPPRSAMQGAIAWALSEPRLTAVVAGARTPEQAAENAGASTVAPLPAAVLERVAGAVRAMHEA